MNGSQWLNLLAILLSPLMAVLVSMWVQDRKEKRGQKLLIFQTLVGTRHEPLSSDHVRALNVIDVVFHDTTKVRQLWHEYFDMLSNEGLNNPVGWEQRHTKLVEMITAMADSLAYRTEITHLDTARIYSPVGHGKAEMQLQAISDELLRVLRATAAVKVDPRPSDQTPPAGSA